MKFFLFLLILLAFLVMSSLYISKEDKSLEVEIKSMKHQDTRPLIELHNKFLKIDVNSKELDLNKTIIEIKEARKIYPLDSTLKTIDMELENRSADEAYRSTYNSTPNN